MTDNVMDKTKERADMASHETRESYERDSCRDDKSGANAFKTTGGEGQNRRDEVKTMNTNALLISKAQTEKPGWT